MKTYIGTKILNAKPMTRGDYNTVRGWTLPDNENGADEAAGSGSERRWRCSLRATRKEVYFEVQFRF